MALTVTHTKVVTGADDPTKEVNAGEWNGTSAHTVAVEDNTLVAAKLSTSATDILFGRSTAAAGAGEEIPCTAAGRAMLDDADAAAQRATLGLGTIATQAANSVAITGGTISGITDLAVADGGTGASTALAAGRNLAITQLISKSAVAVSSPDDTGARMRAQRDEGDAILLTLIAAATL